MDEYVIPAQVRRFVDPDQLVCPGCGEAARLGRPAYWRVADGLPAPEFSHTDGSALCRDHRGAVAGPVETEGAA